MKKIIQYEKTTSERTFKECNSYFSTSITEKSIVIIHETIELENVSKIRRKIILDKLNMLFKLCTILKFLYFFLNC